MRQKFEIWYCKCFLFADAKNTARSMLRGLRNKHGGYDDHHVDGCWYTYKYFYGDKK